ncbi:hypothetical protein Dimus_030505, partial [Dionaea muscipula]
PHVKQLSMHLKLLRVAHHRPCSSSSVQRPTCRAHAATREHACNPWSSAAVYHATAAAIQLSSSMRQQLQPHVAAGTTASHATSPTTRCDDSAANATTISGSSNAAAVTNDNNLQRHAACNSKKPNISSAQVEAQQDSATCDHATSKRSSNSIRRTEAIQRESKQQLPAYATHHSGSPTILSPAFSIEVTRTTATCSQQHSQAQQQHNTPRL